MDGQSYGDLLPESAAIDTTAAEPAPRMDFRQVPAKMAVYLLADEADQPLLLATVGDLRAALQRRLAEAPPDAKTRRIAYGKIAHRVHYRVVHSAFAANLWYYRAARSLYPQTYQDMISWRPAWWISVDPTAEFPRFRRTQDLVEPGLRYVGPILEKNAAGRLIETLEDLFDLCRYYHILVQAPHGKACAYKEMGKCPAPCDGSVSLEHYRGQIAAALQLLSKPADYVGGANVPAPADGPPASPDLSPYQSWRAAREADMRAAAANLEFERATKIRAQLERGTLLEGPAYQWVRSVERFCFLALQPGPGRPYIEPFFIHGGTIESGPPVHKKNLAGAAAEWFTRVAELRQQPVAPPLERMDVEQMGLVVHHLMRGPDDAGIYLPLHDLADAPTIFQAAQDLIARRTPPKPMAEQSNEVPTVPGTLDDDRTKPPPTASKA